MTSDLLGRASKSLSSNFRHRHSLQAKNKTNQFFFSLVSEIMQPFLYFRLVCQISGDVTDVSQPLSITLEVDEGVVMGRYSIHGKAQMDGLSFVVITFS